MTKTYLFAEHVVKLSTTYDFVHNQCNEYICSSAKRIDINISITQQDIDFERIKSENEDKLEGIKIRHFSDDYLESLAVYRKFSEAILKNGYFLIHGSLISVDNKGYLFTAKSGTGKTTHANLWLSHFGKRAEIINGDKPIIKIEADGSVTAFGTPWCGKEKISVNKSVPLKAICVLNRDKINHINPAEKKTAYPLLLQQCYRPADKYQLMLTLSLLEKLCENVKVYLLGCNMDSSAAIISYEGMQ